MSQDSVIRAAALCLAVCLALFSATAQARDEAWLAHPPFEVPVAELDAALDAFEARMEALSPPIEGSKQPRGNDIALLLEEWGFDYDEQGLETLVHRRIFRVLTQGGVQSMNSISGHWEPWHQEQPIMRARVIHADGEVYELDPADAVVRGLPEPNQKIYSDARELVAPLPHLEVGAIVELTIEIHEHRPFCPVGRSHAMSLTADKPVAVVRFWVEQPRQTGFSWVLHGDADLERRELKLPGGRKRRVFTARERAAWDRLEGHLPSDLRLFPMIEYSNAPSWAAVADSYRTLVEQALGDAGTAAAVAPIVQDALGGEDPASMDPRTLVTRLAAAMRARVRYISLNLGEAAIVPRSPRETLQRAYGDCKDQATLLVAVLAAVGIEARVALVTTGPGPDQMHEMPGLDGFDHAIVVVPGPEPLWIDPSHHLVPPGSLPAADQERLALIIDEHTTGLTLTPLTPSADNRLHRIVRMELPFVGPVRITDTARGTGPTEADLRSWGLHVQQTMLEDMKTSAAAHEAGEDGMMSIDHSDPEDLDTPFTATDVRLDSSQGAAGDGEAWVLLPESVFFDYLPYQAWHAPEEGERERDLWYAPFSVELSYQVVPPDGYQIVSKPEPVDRAMGVAHYTRTVEQSGDELLVTFTLDWPQARLSPQQLKATREALMAMGKESTELAVFKHRALIQLEAGDAPGAVATYRQLIEAWPEEPLHKAHLAEQLVKLGMGPAARVWMDRALPQSEGAGSRRRNLILAYDGWVRSHDDIGTYGTGGYDRAAAIEAWRRAVEADADNTNSLFGLTHALRTDEHGEPLAADHPDRIEGLDLLRQARARLDDDAEVAETLLQALIADDAHEEALALAKELPRSGQSAGTMLGQQCILDGAKAATSSSEWRAMDSGLRAQAIGVAYTLLLEERRYQDAAFLLKKLEVDGRNAMVLRGVTEVLEAAVPWEDHVLDQEDPVDVVLQYLSTTLAPDTTPADLAPLFSPHTDVGRLAEGSEHYLEQAQRELRGVAGELVPANGLADLVRAMATGEVIEEVGDDARVRLDLRDPMGGRVQRLEFYLMREDQAWRLVAGDQLAIFELGAEALRRLEQGQPDQAHRLLEWARKDRELSAPSDPWKGWSFLHLTRELDPGDERGLSLAAAVLHNTGGRAPGSIALVEQALEGELDEHTRIVLTRSLSGAYHTAESWEDEARVLRGLLEAYPDQLVPFEGLTGVLPRLAAYRERAERAQARLDLVPDDVQARRILAFSLAELGETDRARELWDQLDREGKVETTDLNQRAWIDVVEDRVDETTLHFAQRAVETSDFRRSASLHTLACALLERGELAKALEVVRHATQIEGFDATNLPEHWWYVAGRTAELLGEPSQALDFYGRMGLPERTSPLLTWHMAQRRLELLEADAK